LRRAAIFVSMLQKIVASALGPGRGALESGFGDGARSRRFNALVEDHGDVRAESELNLGSFLWSQEMLGTVEVGAEANAVIGDFAEIGETENLIAARIGEDGTAPGHERMQAAEFADQRVAGTQIEMIGVGENDFGAECFECFLSESFDGGGGADRHESRRFQDAMRRGEKATPSAGGFGMLNFEGKTHFASVSGECESDSDTQDHIDEENTENDDEGLAGLELSGIYSGKADGEEHEFPDFKEVDVLAESDEPLGGIVGKDGGEICSDGIVEVKHADRFEEQDD
jgi:hypothetical protein